jgi:hypothetical protein
MQVNGHVSPDFLRDLTGWVGGLPATANASPQIAGGTPHQTYWAAASPTPRWFGDGQVILVVVLAAAGLLVLGQLVVLGVVVWRRVRGLPARRRFGRGVAGLLGWIGVLALSTVAALVWYLVAVARLALDYERNSVIVQGGWVGVRLLGIGAVVAGASLLDRVRHQLGDDPRVVTGVLARVVAWSTVASAGALLVVTAYWGVFQLGI